MKLEQVIELLKQSGIHDYIVQNPNKDEWGYGSDCIMCDGIERFAFLVEQATIERAAQACEQSEAYRGSVFASRIRALKEDACE